MYREISHSLAEDDGSFLKSSEKLQLMHVLLKETAINLSNSVILSDSLRSTAASDREVTVGIVDGMAFVHGNRRKASTATHLEILLATSHGSAGNTDASS